MSAITGIFNFNEDPVHIEHATNMMESLQQFPSDNIDTWHNSTVFLGCHAQWITPESIGERLPYYDYERDLAITSDAIIDNREELFGLLHIECEARKIMSDSQLILLAYSKWGEETPKYLLGDFAFMIWDGCKRQLFGARDFSGSRTLYFYHDHSQFAFSTIIEPLLTLPYIEKQLNEEWLAEFIAIPTMVEAVDPLSTVYKTVKQIPPSHSITVREGRVNLSRYDTLIVEEKLILESDEEYVEAFRDVFQKAVSVRLRTHGKVGSHLSGGLDSGTVVSFAAKELQRENKRLHTYSYVPDDDFVDWTSKYYIPDERPFIKETVGHVGNIEDHYLSFAGKTPYTEVDEFLSLMEMPYKFFENSYWLKGITETAQKDGVKILLNGARGNHSISWGSYQLNLEYYVSLFKKIKWLKLYHELGLYCETYHTGKSVMLPAVFEKAFPTLARIINKQSQFDYHFPPLINPTLAQQTNVYEKLITYGIDPATGKMADHLKDHRINHYKQLYVWNKSGVANTKLSLRYSVWDRDPTNDLNVIRFCLAVPDEQYVRNGMERSLLRSATKHLLPDKVRLNHYVSGLQGADTIHRMTSQWDVFLDEIETLTRDSVMKDLINVKVIKNAISDIGKAPRPEMIFEDNFKILTRSLILYRFINSLGKGGDENEKKLEKTRVGSA